MALLIGDEFNSFEQFQQALIAYKNAKFMDFAISDCSKKNLSKKILPKVKNIILQSIHASMAEFIKNEKHV